MSLEIIGQSIPNMPWMDRPEGCKDVVWRYDANPIIPRDLLPTSNSIFNSAVVPFEGKFAGVFRVDDKERNMAIHAGFSEDGIHWNINPEKVEWINDDPLAAEANPWQYGYDPRCVWIEDRYWITWCNATAGSPLSAWAGQRTSRSSTSARMHTSPSTETAFCSPERSTASM